MAYVDHERLRIYQDEDREAATMAGLSTRPLTEIVAAVRAHWGQWYLIMTLIEHLLQSGQYATVQALQQEQLTVISGHSGRTGRHLSFGDLLEKRRQQCSEDAYFLDEIMYHHFIDYQRTGQNPVYSLSSYLKVCPRLPTYLLERLSHFNPRFDMGRDHLERPRSVLLVDHDRRLGELMWCQDRIHTDFVDRMPYGVVRRNQARHAAIRRVLGACLNRALSGYVLAAC